MNSLNKFLYNWCNHLQIRISSEYWKGTPMNKAVHLAKIYNKLFQILQI